MWRAGVGIVVICSPRWWTWWGREQALWWLPESAEAQNLAMLPESWVKIGSDVWEEFAAAVDEEEAWKRLS